jgi:hypothetical protein
MKPSQAKQYRYPQATPLDHKCTAKTCRPQQHKQTPDEKTIGKYSQKYAEK